MDCSPPGSSIHGILQARILAWVAMPFLQGIFPLQGSGYHLSHQGSPDIYKPLNKHGRFYYYYYIIISHKENTPGDGKHGPWGLADVAWGFLVIPEPRLSMKREHGCCRN